MTVDSQKLFQWLTKLLFLFFGLIIGNLCPPLPLLNQINLQSLNIFLSNIKPRFFYNSYAPIIIFLISLLLGCLWNLVQKQGIPVQNIDKHLENRRTEGLKALADWSKWIITIQASFIAIITLKIGENTAANEIISSSINPALLSFTLSIFAATILLGSIPNALAIDLKSTTDKPSNDIYRHRTNLVFSIGSFATAEHILFLFGILAITLELTS